MATRKKFDPATRPGTGEAKAAVVSAIAGGSTVRDAMQLVSRSLDSYEYWRRTDPDFKARVDKSRKERDEGFEATKKYVPDFPEFCEQYLQMKLWTHQLQWFDMIEGREPRDLHPAATFEQGKQSRLLINIPPGFAKSTTVTLAYVVWRVVKNPNIKVGVISKTQAKAAEFLLQIKERLTDPLYQELIDAFAPSDGFDSDSAGWSAHRIYLSSKVREAKAKDPTVQALGIGGQLYGARLDLVILDDCIDNLNAGDYEKQAKWVLSVVSSRLAPRRGVCVVIGTRMAHTDLYSQLTNPEIYPRGVQPWTMLRQPAVLEYAEDPAEWVTLWPYTDQPEDPDDVPGPNGLYVRFDGPTLAEIRDTMTSDEWSRMYQQEQISSTGAFPQDLVNAARSMYQPGNLAEVGDRGRKGGVEGLRILAGLDPAVTGFTAAVVLGVDPITGDIWVINCFNKANVAPAAMRDMIRDWTVRYEVQEWLIEKNAFQGFLTNDEGLREFLNQHGSLIRPHYTSGQLKHDPDHGVASMSLTFERHKIHFPNFTTEAVRQLVDQLVGWEPGVGRPSNKKKKYDLVMALWFAHLRANELIRSRRTVRHMASQFHTRADRFMQRVVTREEMAHQAYAAGDPR